jgi:hypothetical protein
LGVAADLDFDAAPPSPTTEGLALRGDPPREDRVVRAVARRSGRGYRWLEGLVWTVCVLVVSLVAFTSKSHVLDTFLGGLAMVAVMFGLPVSIFAAINLRKLKRLAREGTLTKGTVVGARLVGAHGSAITDVSVSLVGRGGRALFAYASGLRVLPELGATLDVLMLDGDPPLAALVDDTGHVVVARVTRDRPTIPSS